ncbi:hypothetical protein ACJ73_06551 [Blastomyces percursus]|uniref:Protein-arginine deiminase C-terminal domain-containing protein n=1 Tax=Blastomyces percursus TaxID=1658174 RepID=A0A1J9R0V0_9EURO|nr:hypothetical protein ACJ73_06551 [Blastomyces percursus]
MHWLLSSLQILGEYKTEQNDRLTISSLLTDDDGRVDIDGNTDIPHKLNHPGHAGAIFLANIGDTDRRCSSLALSDSSPSNEKLAACNDASDDIQRSPQYLAPLRTVPISCLNPNAYGTVSVEDAIARKNVRIFRREGSNWLITPNDHMFTNNQLQQGLNLGIDARDTRRPSGWDGRVTVHFTVHDREDVSRQCEAASCSHFMLPSFSFGPPGSHHCTKFVSAFDGALAEMNVNFPLFKFNASDDIWAQDFFEPGYTSMPGPDGPVTLRVMIRSAQDTRVAGRQVFEYLRAAGTGAVQHLGGALSKAKKYPAGRIVLGSHEGKKPYILEYLQAQEIQDPLLVDVDWLAVGHVDEMLQFLPANNSLGWVMLVPDPQEGLAILRRAQSAGHGKTCAFSRQNDTEGNLSDLFGLPWGSRGVPSYTIDDLLSQNELREANANFSKRIKATVGVIKRETGITDADIYGLPVVFRTGLTYPPDVGIDPERSGSSKYAGSLYPATINGLVLRNTKYLAPNPWGPVVNNGDIMADAVSEVYCRLGFKVGFVDDWNSHHTWGGEVH